MKKREKIISKLNPLIFDGVAHRGIHDNREIPENSMTAFLKAKEEGVALELDVHLTTDNKLAVVHDSELKRVTGKDGVVEEMSMLDIRKNYKLKDGSDIPTIEEVIDQIEETVPIVLEIKVYKGNGKLVGEAVKKMLEEKVKDKSNYYIISFSPNALSSLEGCGFQRSLLITYKLKYRICWLFRKHFEGADIDFTYFEKKPHSAKNLKKKQIVNCYTIETEQQLDKYAPYCDTVTFQYLDPKIVKSKLQQIREENNQQKK